MDTGRLKLIVRAIRDDWQRTDAIRKINGVIQAINTQIQTPNEQNQKQIVALFEDLKESLDKSNLAKIPQTWRSTVGELGVSDYIGRNLFERIASILDPSNAILITARDELTRIRGELTGLNEGFGKLLEGLSVVGVEDTALKPGEGEVSVLVPRVAVSNELGLLAKEVVFFDNALRFFSELVTGSREPAKLRGLSTTDPLVVITAAPTVAAAVIFVVDQILDLIEKTLRLRKLRSDAKIAEADAQIITLIAKQATTQIETGVVSIEKLLLARYQSVQRSTGRASELATEAHQVVSGIARRLDNGYQVDADAEPLSESDAEVTSGAGSISTDESQSPFSKSILAANEVKQIASKVRYFDAGTEPVLNLPPPPGEDV